MSRWTRCPADDSLLVCGVDRGRVEGLAAAGRCLAHRDEDHRGRDEVDLSGLLAAVLPQCDGDEDAERVRAVALEERPRHMRRPGHERLDDVRVDGNRKRVEELLTGRVDELYPACAHPRRG